MYTRRDFANLIVGALGASALLGPLGAAARRSWAASRKVLTRATTRESLIHENPADLDTTDLEITPLDKFDTMGPTDRVVDLATWRLEIAGLVRRPARFTYAELTALPTIEREDRTLCPARGPVRQSVSRHPRQWNGASPQARLPASGGGRRSLRSGVGKVCRSAHR